MARISPPLLAHGPAETAHSGIREIANEALRTPGAIRLDVGQPDFPTPQHIKDAGKRAIDENKTFYTHTQGLLSLRERLVAKLDRVNGIKSSPERITIGPGGVGALAAVFAAVLEQGDEVLLPDPGWPNYRMMLAWTGARGVLYPCPPARGADHTEDQTPGSQQSEQPNGSRVSTPDHRGICGARPAAQPVADQ
jgi:aspartate/methionine/tyrosine aminotransferase